MRHLYECPMRWADLDQLGHVNNVVYVDYLQEARVDMLRTHGQSMHDGALAEGVVVVRHEVSYLSTLGVEAGSVSIQCWVTEIRAASFTMAYEIFHPDPSSPSARRVYVRATTVLTPYVFATERPRRLSSQERELLGEYLEPTTAVRAPHTDLPLERARHHPVQVRFSDVDVYGHVNNVKYFEYFQEARVGFNAHTWAGLPPGESQLATVVAQSDVDYRAPILFRPEVYDVRTWVSRVGNRSFVQESQIRDGDTVLSRARTVMVFFDAAAGHSVVPSDAYREPLLATLGSS